MAIIHKGRVLEKGNPGVLRKQFEGKIWEKHIAREDYEAYREKFRIIYTRLEESTPVIHVYSDTKPDESFTLKNPTVQDLYFHYVQSEEDPNI